MMLSVRASMVEQAVLPSLSTSNLHGFCLGSPYPAESFMACIPPVHLQLASCFACCKLLPLPISCDKFWLNSPHIKLTTLMDEHTMDGIAKLLLLPRSQQLLCCACWIMTGDCVCVCVSLAATDKDCAYLRCEATGEAYTEAARGKEERQSNAESSSEV